jgi:hypothetical protein
MDVRSDRRGTWTVRPYLAYLAWAQALVATVGRLFFREVIGYMGSTAFALGTPLPGKSGRAATGIR